MEGKYRNEKGAVLVVAIFVIMALVVVGSLAAMVTTVELDISRNDRFGKEAFFIADAGCPISTKVLKDMILNEGIDYSDYYEKYEANGITFDSTLFLNEVMNYYDPDLEPELNDKLMDSTDSKPDISSTVSGRELNVDVDWRHRKSGAGGSLLSAMGYEGIGADRSHGGVKIYYDVTTKGKVSKNTTAEIMAVYLNQ